MSIGAFIAILVGLVILDLVVWHFVEILWQGPNRRAEVQKLESKVGLVLMLVLVPAALAGIPFALSRGRFLPAAACAFCLWVVWSNHRRQGQERES